MWTLALVLLCLAVGLDIARRPAGREQGGFSLVDAVSAATKPGMSVVGLIARTLIVLGPALAGAGAACLIVWGLFGGGKSSARVALAQIRKVTQQLSEQMVAGHDGLVGRSLAFGHEVTERRNDGVVISGDEERQREALLAVVHYPVQG